MTNEEIEDAFGRLNAFNLQMEARANASDFLLTSAVALLYESHGLGVAEVRLLRAEILRQVARIAHPTLDAAMSDHWAAELESAAAGLLSRVETILQRKLEGGRG